MNNFIKNISLALVFIYVCFAVSNAQDPQDKKPLKTVLIESLKPENLVQAVELSAEVVAVEKAVLSSTAEGPIGTFSCREGDHVQAGDKIIEISRDLFKADVEVAEASLKVAKAKLADLKAGYRPQEINKARESVKEAQKSIEYMKNEVERVRALVASKALPSDDLEKAQVKFTAEESRLKSAKNNLEMLESGMTNTTIAVQKAFVDEAEAKLNLAKAKLNECQILAPFQGVVTQTFVSKGDLASAKMPLLELTNMESQVIRCAIPEILSGQIRVGMKAEYSLDAIPKKVFKGKISRVFPRLEDRLRTRMVEISPDSFEELLPGMFARAKILVREFPEAISIPGDVVQQNESGKSFVFTLSQENKAKKIMVDLGPEIDGRIIVNSGLHSGDRLIKAGFEKLKDGELVASPGEKQKKENQK